MSWFAVRIRLRSEVVTDEGRCENGIVEETVLLFRAHSDAEAREKAKVHCRSIPYKYMNSTGEQVSVVLDSIVDVQDTCEEEIFDGIEVYSQMFLPERYPEL